MPLVFLSFLCCLLSTTLFAPNNQSSRTQDDLCFSASRIYHLTKRFSPAALWLLRLVIACSATRFQTLCPSTQPWYPSGNDPVFKHSDDKRDTQKKNVFAIAAAAVTLNGAELADGWTTQQQQQQPNIPDSHHLHIRTTEGGHGN